MKLHLTRAQLLHEWRLRAFPEPVNDAATGVTRNDGINLDALVEARCEDWYHHLLAFGPTELLAPVDMADTLTPLPDGIDGSRRYRLPEGLRRVVEIKAGNHPARVLYDAAARLFDPGMLLFDPTPVALVDNDTLTLYAPAPLDSALMVCHTTDGLYHLDAAAFDTVKSWI